MSHKQGIVLFVLLGLIAAGCGGGEEEDASGKAPMKVVRGKAYADAPKDSDSEFRCVAIFINEPGQVALHVEVEGAPKSTLLVNIHQGTDCEAPGGRWNPDGMDRANWEEGVASLGDIGSIEVGDDGEGSVDVTTGRWTMGSAEANDVLGQVILVFDIDESGGSEPLGCGVIKPG